MAILEEIAIGVEKGDSASVHSLTEKALAQDIPAVDILNNGLVFKLAESLRLKAESFLGLVVNSTARFSYCFKFLVISFEFLIMDAAILKARQEAHKKVMELWDKYRDLSKEILRLQADISNLLTESQSVGQQIYQLYQTTDKLLNSENNDDG